MFYKEREFRNAGVMSRFELRVAFLTAHATSRVPNAYELEQERQLNLYKSFFWVASRSLELTE